ncbi:MAG: type II secretion system GspH family protein [Pirellulaceae bacterium]|nr:type II secretion system GspH family protein [Pirellulaceae bacterium]
MRLTSANSNFLSKGRYGFSLIELLVVISILSLLMGLGTVAYMRAAQEAKEIRTQTQIEKLDVLIMERVEEFQYRSVRVPAWVERDARLDSSLIVAEEVARYRLESLREKMRMELPDRVSDVIDPDMTTQAFSEKGEYTPRANRYYRRVLAVKESQSDPTTWRWSRTFQGAECLYLIVREMTPDSDQFFTLAEIGDVDGDGMKEFLDAWGNPIGFIRWPRGFSSPKQPFVQFTDGTGNLDLTKLKRDPFDPFNIDRDNFIRLNDHKGTFMLTPLIYSAGPDELYDIRDDELLVDSGPTENPFVYSYETGSFPDGLSPSGIPNDPYSPLSGQYLRDASDAVITTDNFIGQPEDLQKNELVSFQNDPDLQILYFPLPYTRERWERETAFGGTPSFSGYGLLNHFDNIHNHSPRKPN